MALVYSETVVHSSIFFSGYRTMKKLLRLEIISEIHILVPMLCSRMRFYTAVLM